LMPCGPLQAMQLYALSTGSPLKGALSMLLFSLGTVPLMFGLGALSSLLSKKFTQKMMQVSAMLVIILGIVMFQNGMGLSGLMLPSISSKGNDSTVATQQNGAVSDGVQLITTQLSSGSYEPITVKVGIPVKWTIHAAAGTVTGCNNRLVIPAYNIEKKLVVGDNVIEFTPVKTGTVPYSCWMGMIRSKITVNE
jgi:plastocyanin domain-containing protein